MISTHLLCIKPRTSNVIRCRFLCHRRHIQRQSPVRTVLSAVSNDVINQHRRRWHRLAAQAKSLNLRRRIERIWRCFERTGIQQPLLCKQVGQSRHRPLSSEQSRSKVPRQSPPSPSQTWLCQTPVTSIPPASSQWEAAAAVRYILGVLRQVGAGGCPEDLSGSGRTLDGDILTAMVPIVSADCCFRRDSAFVQDIETGWRRRRMTSAHSSSRNRQQWLYETNYAVLPRKKPHYGLHPVCLAVCPSLCLSCQLGNENT